MQLDAVTAEIRPRSDWEAVDLGFAMVRRDFWRCISVWWLAVLVPTVLAGWWLWEMPLLWFALFWWWKPAGSRMVLFEISRRLFGERPKWSEVFREIPKAWSRRFFHRFIFARFSPWLPVTLAVEDLENLRGKAYRQRASQVVRRGEGVVMWLYFISDTAAAWLGLGLLGLVLMLMPQGQDGGWQLAVESWDPDHPTDIPVLISRVVALCLMAAVSLTDLFVIGAGFGIYINNRTWLEGWDVELAFKRLAQRLGKVAVVLLALGFAIPAVARAEDDPQTVIREVKAEPEFKVHTVTDKVPNPKSGGWWDWLDFLGGAGGAVEFLSTVFFIAVIGLLVGLLAWICWKFRHAFTMRRGGGREEKMRPSARVVMGMEVTRESLPENIPNAAWALWGQGRHHEALALLYRGAISHVIRNHHVEILESDTEGDCLRRVGDAGVHQEYFKALTHAWSHLAYAGVRPADGEIRSLCGDWPYVERRVS